MEVGQNVILLVNGMTVTQEEMVRELCRLFLDEKITYGEFIDMHLEIAERAAGATA